MTPFAGCYLSLRGA